MIDKYHLRMGPAVLVPAIISAVAAGASTGVAAKAHSDQKKAMAKAEQSAADEKAKAQAELDATALKKKQEMEGRIKSSTGGAGARYGDKGDTLLSPTYDTASIFK